MNLHYFLRLTFFIQLYLSSILHPKGKKSYNLAHFGSSVIGDQIFVLLGEQLNKEHSIPSLQVYHLNVINHTQILEKPWIISKVKSEEDTEEDTLMPLKKLACQTMKALSEEVLCFGGEYLNKRGNPLQGPFLSYNVKSNNWTILTLPDKAPSPRFGHAMINMKDDEIYLFGGKVYHEEEEALKKSKLDVWVVNKEKKWNSINSDQDDEHPGERAYHTLTKISATKFLLIGGALNQTTTSKDVFIFDIETKKWERKETVNYPNYTFSEHSAVYFDEAIYVHGGFDNKIQRGRKEIYRLDLNNFNWNLISLDEPLPERYGHHAIMVEEAMFIYFGVVNPPSLSLKLINLKTQKQIVELNDSIRPSLTLEEQAEVRSNQVNSNHSNILLWTVGIILILALLGYLWYRKSVRQDLDFQPLPTGEPSTYDDLEFEEFEPEYK